MKTNERLMGSQVVVTKKYVRSLYINEEDDYSSVEKWWEEETIKPRKGWVVGFRNLSNFCDETEFEQGEIIKKERTLLNKIPCVLVCFWPTEKPVRVPLDGFKEKPSPCWKTKDEMLDAEYWWACTPFCSSGLGNSTLDRYVNQNNLKCRAAKQKRDAKGRFV